MGVEYDDSEVTAGMKKLKNIIKHARPVNYAIGLVLIGGFREQWKSKGAFWGSKWHDRGEWIKSIRKWQGYREDTTLTATGATRQSITTESVSINESDTGVVVGSPLAHIKNLQEGTGSNDWVAFRGRGGSGGVRYGRFPKIHQRDILPRRIPDSIKRKIMRAIGDEIGKALR